MERSAAAREAAEGVFERYPRLGERRDRRASVLSAGAGRLLEIGRAPQPSTRPCRCPTSLRSASSRASSTWCSRSPTTCNTAMADVGDELLADPEVGRLFLGG